MNVTSDERQNMELNDVDECDLAAAHQAFYVATGKDLFDGKMVRTRDRGLFVWSGGLGIIDKSSLVSSHGINIDDPHGCIVVSCSLPRDLQKDFLYWLTRQWGAEIGLIIGRPGAPTLFIEIKSTERVTTEHMRRLRDLSAERDDVEPLCVSPKIGTHHFEHLAL